MLTFRRFEGRTESLLERALSRIRSWLLGEGLSTGGGDNGVRVSSHFLGPPGQDVQRKLNIIKAGVAHIFRRAFQHSPKVSPEIWSTSPILIVITLVTA